MVFSKLRRGKKVDQKERALFRETTNIHTRPSGILLVPTLEDSIYRQGLASSSHSTRSLGANDDVTHNSKDGQILQRSVSFGDINIRDYERIATDNPCVSQGVPIGIGWQFYDHTKLKLEDYEMNRSRRSKAQMLMSAMDREYILRKQWEISQREIAAAVRQSIKVKNQRRQTILMDNDPFWNTLNKTKKRVEGFVSKIRKVEEDDADVTYLSSYDYSSTAVNGSVRPLPKGDSELNSTRHRGNLMTTKADDVFTGNGTGRSNNQEQSRMFVDDTSAYSKKFELTPQRSSMSFAA